MGQRGEGMDPDPPPPKSVLESANPRMDWECASGCPWSTARATLRQTIRDRGLVPTPPPPRGSLCYCTCAKEAISTKSAGRWWLVSGLQDHLFCYAPPPLSSQSVRRRSLGGLGMTLWRVLVCSGRRLSAERHSLPFPWALSLRRRRPPSAPQPLTPSLSPLPGLSSPPPHPLPFPPEVVELEVPTEPPSCTAPCRVRTEEGHGPGASKWGAGVCGRSVERGGGGVEYGGGGGWHKASVSDWLP